MGIISELLATVTLPDGKVIKSPPKNQPLSSKDESKKALEDTDKNSGILHRAISGAEEEEKIISQVALSNTQSYLNLNSELFYPEAKREKKKTEKQISEDQLKDNGSRSVPPSHIDVRNTLKSEETDDVKFFLRMHAAAAAVKHKTTIQGQLDKCVIDASFYIPGRLHQRFADQSGHEDSTKGDNELSVKAIEEIRQGIKPENLQGSTDKQRQYHADNRKKKR